MVETKESEVETGNYMDAIEKGVDRDPEDTEQG